MPGRGLLLALTLIVGLCVLGVTQTAAGDDCLRPAGVQKGDVGSLADLGVKALERLPWDAKILRANLSADKPVAIAACYLMQDDLLAISQTGLVYCMSRRDLEPRWVQSLKAPLAALPSEGAGHYAFLVKATDGSYWVHAFRKRSGAEENGFPSRMPFAASAGLGNNGGRVFVSSLGSPRNNKTLETVSLANGDLGWGWRTRGLLWASPVCDPSGNSVIIAGEDGTITSLPGGMDKPREPNWARRMTGAVTATPAVTPEHVLVGSNDGTLRCLELGSGEVLWMHGIDAAIRTSPWILGGMETVKRETGVEGASEVAITAYTGVAFARNRDGLFAFDLRSGEELFKDGAGSRPLCRQGNYVLVLDGNKNVLFRDKSKGYEVKGKLPLSMFDLIPANTTDGAIFACTHDGGIVAAIPAP